MKKNKQVLGYGVYRLSDVARYIGLHPRRLRTWFVNRPDTKVGSVFDSDYSSLSGARVVSFLDLIDALVVAGLRDRGVSMPTIRKAYAVLAKKLGTSHPFAHRDVYTDGKSVFEYAAEAVDDDVLSEVVSQQLFFPMVRERLEKIEYAEDSELATRWQIAKGIVIDPSVSFGQPVISGTGVTTYVAARSYLANDRNADLVGELFGITPNDVLDAVAFEERYSRQYAA